MRLPLLSPSAPRTLPFAADHATVQAIAAADPHATSRRRRTSAYARFEATKRKLALPFRKIAWLSGERVMRTQAIRSEGRDANVTDDGRPVDELATIALANAGGIVHFGALAIKRGGNVPEGVCIKNLHDALRDHPELMEAVLARRIDRAKNADAHLLGAFMNCGALITVAEGVRLRDPLQLLWIHAPGQTQAVFPFIAIVVGKYADVTIIERHHGDGDAFVCGMTDARVAEGGSLNYVVLQHMSEGSQFRMQRSATTDAHATAAWHLADLGAVSVRNTVTGRANGDASRHACASLSFRSGKQRIDNRFYTEVRGAHVRVRNTGTIALADSAAAKQHERLLLARSARSGDAVSDCAGLLLSRKAAIELRPDRSAMRNAISVRQRARVGSIDAEAMFYLATRGIDHATARKIIALGFFEPAILAFPSEILRDEVRTALDERIEDAI